MPGIVTGLIMAFTLSLDDFVISYFTAGQRLPDLPIRIYNMTKKTVTPKMYALATIIFFVILALLILTNLVDSDPKTARAKAQTPRRKGASAPDTALSRASSTVLLLIGMIAVLVLRRQRPTLNVYNWGEYISDGSDDSLDTIKAFEEWYYETYGVKVKVNSHLRQQ